MGKKGSIHDRPDGVYVKEIDGYHKIMTNLYPKRTDSEVYTVEKLEVSHTLSYLKNKNELHPEYRSTFFHVVVTALIVMIYNRPLMNRFIANKKYFDRKFVSISFVAKAQFEDHAEDIVLCIRAEDDMTFDDISKFIYDETNRVRSSDDTSDANGLINKITKLPDVAVSLFVLGYKMLEKHGRIPSAMLKADCNFTSILLSNLGSIHGGACHHHLNNYGTNSILVTIGEIRKENTINQNGDVEEQKFAEFGVTADERIADGYYLTKSIKLARYLIANPELLEKPVSELLSEDILNKAFS